MLSREILKIASLSRHLFYRRFLVNRKLCLRTCLCNTTPFRSICTVSTSRAPDKKLFKYDNRVKEIKNENATKTSGFTKEKNIPSDTEKKLNPISNEELLEKYIAGLSTDIHLKNRVYKNDLQRVIAKVKSFNFSTKKQQLLLLRCCTELLADEAPLTRMNLAEEIWTTIEKQTKLSVEHYNELLRVYLANSRSLVARSFIRQMGDVKPDITTYELILAVLGESGDINQATEVISNMKALNIPATESIFHSLIVCQGKAGNIQNINEVLTMMKSLKLERTADTYLAVARALAFNKQSELLVEEIGTAYKNGIQFEEKHIMEIVKTLAVVGMYNVVPRVLQYLPEKTLKSPSISAYMQSVATQLVFMNHPIVALELYKCLPLPSFGPKDDRGLHGRSLVRDCVKASMPSSVIGLITQELMASGRNPIALNNAAEAALQLGKAPLVLDLFTRMKQLGMPLRPHYFWPILILSSKTYGEKGIMNTLQTMMSMDVTPDYDTIMDYALPYTSFTSPQNLMKKFLETGITVSAVLTPMMETLLNTGQVRAASEICELFQGKVEGDKLIKPLARGYLISLDLKSTIHLLEDISAKATDRSKDWVGRFLCHFISNKKGKGDLQDFLCILKGLRHTQLKISTSAADYCLSHIPENYCRDKMAAIREEIVMITDERLIDEAELFSQSIPHPKHMTEEALRSHLVELEAKGMNTRGVLRKLLQEYCRTNNLAAAREIVEKCIKEGVFLSAGMKASIFDLHVKQGELELAEMVLSDLNKSAPNFVLDEFKVIDFATLMVYRKKIDRAVEMIKEQSMRRNVIGGINISMNCWRLLDAVAAQADYKETKEMFDLLLSLGYCKPTNVIMGPLIRVHLKKNDLEAAVSEFVRIANKYNKTPLKHELLCRILKSNFTDGCSKEQLMADKPNSKSNRLVQTVLSVNKKIHGSSDVHLTLIAALADIGYKKSLRKLLLDPKVKFHPDALLRRCERFADERKINALENFAECAHDLRHVDVTDVYDLILDVYQRDDMCENAITLFNKLQDLDITPSNKFVRNLAAMLKSNNKQIPPELSILISKQQSAKAEKV